MADPRTEIARALRADEWVQRHLGIVAHARDVADTAVAALEAAGFVLLPPGGEVSAQWTVRWRWTPTGEVDELTRPASEETARTLLRDAQRMEAAEAILYRRDTRTYEHGSQYIGPWSPVVSDNSEGESSG